MRTFNKGDLETIAKLAGAIVPCGNCGLHDVSACDDAATGTAYEMVTNAWRRGEFGNDSREEIIEAMNELLEDANYTGPGCD